MCFPARVQFPAALEKTAPLLAQVALVAAEVGIGRQRLRVDDAQLAFETVAELPVPGALDIAPVVVELAEVVELDLRQLGVGHQALAADRAVADGAGFQRAPGIGALVIEGRRVAGNAQQVVVVGPADAAVQVEPGAGNGERGTASECPGQ
jgi:hypothetical protein